MKATNDKQRAGKTWQRIVDDLLRYVPGVGFLAMDPVQAGRSTSARAFNHLGFLSPPQVPWQEAVGDFGIRMTLTYSNTRYHVNIDIKSSNANADHDFHLMQYSRDGKHEYYSWESPSTDTYLEIAIIPPHLSEADLEDYEEAAVKERFNKYKDQKPSASCPTPSACLATLYKILNQPLASPSAAKVIPENNTTLILRVNPDILLKKFEFTHEDGEYRPPNLIGDDAITVLRRRRLIQIMNELYILTMNRQNEEGNHHNHIQNIRMEVATRSLKEVLPHPNSSANTVGSPSPPITDSIYAHYLALGACEYFSSDLITRRYDIQAKNDPENRPHYLEALIQIGQVVDDSNLQIRGAELMSMGFPTYSALKQAYQDFDVDPDLSDNVEGVYLVNRYKALVRESPALTAQLKQSLETIRAARSSPELNEFVALENMNLENAYSFLEATPESDDDSVKALFDFKAANLGEGKDEMAKRALLTIAKARMSSILLSHYENLTFGTAEEMTAESAYDLLGCTPSMDAGSIITVFDIRLSDAPDNVLEFRQALRAIANADVAKQRAIREYLGDQEPVKKERTPVGLGNIGNTCYLNSLLQCMYTIVPLRDSVLNFQDSPLKEDPREVENEDKKVGGRKVRDFEVTRSQMFIRLLAELFSEMNDSDRQYVIPKKELAYMALVPPTFDEEDIRNMEANKESSDEILDQVDGTQASFNSQDLISIDDDNDDSEIVTQEVIDGHSLDEDDSMSSISKRGRTPSQEAVRKRQIITSSERDAEGADSPSSLETQDSDTETPEAAADIDDDAEMIEVVVKETMPPPLPRRNTHPENSESIGTEKNSVKPPSKYVYPRADQIETAMTLSGQQDVTECIDNVLFQIEACFKPESKEADGEQQDIVKQLFYGKSRQILENANDGSNRREQVNRFNCFLISASNGSQNIYDALDENYGESIIETSGAEKEQIATRRTETIIKLPEVLQVQIQRVQYNRELQAPFKDTSLIKFDEVIYMDRYMDTDDVEVIRKRREVAVWKLELRDLKDRKEALNKTQNNGLTVRAALMATRDWLNSVKQQEPEMAITVSEETMATLNEHIDKLTRENDEVDFKIADLEKKIENQFSEMKKIGYRVHSVFIHRGTATQGHYWIYINDIQNGCFRKYNDEYVDELPYSEVFSEDTSNSAPTPYYVTFVREDLAKTYVEAIRPPPPTLLVSPSVGNEGLAELPVSEFYEESNRMVVGSSPVFESKGDDLKDESLINLDDVLPKDESETKEPADDVKHAEDDEKMLID